MGAMAVWLVAILLEPLRVVEVETMEAILLEQEQEQQEFGLQRVAGVVPMEKHHSLALRAESQEETPHWRG